MSTKIKGAEYPLSKIFSSDFMYKIPGYQRPYAWTEEEAGTLFDDLYDFYTGEDKEETYFLGSIVLIKEEDQPPAEVIDGQQRLTTLTILLAALTSRLTGNDRDDYKNYIIEPGRESQGILPMPRLRLRPRDNDFFGKYIQNMDFQGLAELKEDALDTEAKINIMRNAKLLLKKLDEKFGTPEECKAFGRFLVNRCYLVAVSTPARASAFRVFSIMNNRGMSLLASDIIKSDVIGKIPEEKQSLYTEKWEEMEAELTRSGFNDLFGQIRMIRMKTKAKKSLQEEFSKFVLPDLTGDRAMDFIDRVLDPFSTAYRVINDCEYSASVGADEVNDILRWLCRIDNSDWLPAAMLYYVKHSNDPEALNRFLRKLERLAVFMRVRSWDVNHRIERYARVLEEIEKEEGGGLGEAVELTNGEIEEFLQVLDSDIYKMVSKKRNYLVLRLDSFVADGAANYSPGVLTIEHVLPQTVKPGSEWDLVWRDPAEREKWLHKIANLVPLTRRANSEAQNYAFDVKKEKYFSSKSGTSSYALTTQVLKYKKWTPADVESRQKELIDAYVKGWDLTKK